MNPEHKHLTFSKDGTPFASEIAAKSAITRLGLDPDTHTAVQVEGGGWGIGPAGAEGALPSPGAPKSETLPRVLQAKEDSPGYFAEAARALCFIPPGVVSKGVPSVMARAEKFTPTEEQAAAMWPTLKHVIDMNNRANKVMEVIFSAKSSPNDTDEVMLACQGERLVVQREQKVCIPWKFLESAKNATYPTFKTEAGKPRKRIGTLCCYPFTEIREATMAEFVAQREAGTKATREYVEKYGVEEQVGG